MGRSSGQRRRSLATSVHQPLQPFADAIRPLIAGPDIVQELSRLPALREDASLANRPSPYISYYACSGTPLANAAAAGHLEVVQLLLASGADPNLPERNIAPDGRALYAAAANRHIEIARTLLEHGARANPEVESSADALTRAISNDDQAMINLLCSYGASRKPHLLAHYGYVRTAAAVFAAAAALADDPGALASAAGEGHEPFVRLMLRHVPNLARKVVLPAWQPAAKTQPLAEFLYRNGMNPNKADWLGVTSLHQFARLGDIENMKLALAMERTCRFGTTTYVRRHSAGQPSSDSLKW